MSTDFTDSTLPRWVTRLASLSDAVANLRQAQEFFESKEPLNPLYITAFRELLIHRFETAWELAWRVLQDYLTYIGVDEVKGPRGVLRQALNRGLIHDAAWLRGLELRNLSTHQYGQAILDEVPDAISSTMMPLLQQLLHDLEVIKQQEI